MYLRDMHSEVKSYNNKRIYVFFILLFLSPLTFAQSKSAKDTATILLKDHTKYSKQFLTRLKTFTYSSHYELRDSMMIIGELDTTYFPTELALQKDYTFAGIKKNRQFELHVKRINYTTVKYMLRLYKSWKMVGEYKGEAHLAPGFFLGAETDEDDRTGNAYLASEYYSTVKNCDISLRIGENGSQIKTKVIITCKHKWKNVGLDDCPTLYIK